MGSYFRIAELAKLYGLNSDTLRYYEEQGLIHPRRGANGYREYSVDDLWDLNIIRSLRELGVGMEEIRQYFCAPRTVAGTDAMLAGQEEMLHRKMAALQKRLTAVQQRRQRLRQAMDRPAGQVLRLELPERPCLFLREKAIPEPKVDYLLRKLQKDRRSLLKELGNRRMGAVMEPAVLWDDRLELLYSGVFFLCEEGEQADGAFPAGTYLSLIHAGPYATIRESYRQLYACAEAEGLQVLDTPLEFYLTDIHDTGVEAEFRTELQMRVGDGTSFQ